MLQSGKWEENFPEDLANEVLGDQKLAGEKPRWLALDLLKSNGSCLM